VHDGLWEAFWELVCTGYVPAPHRGSARAWIAWLILMAFLAALVGLVLLWRRL